jgi:hypothetical protein
MDIVHLVSRYPAIWRIGLYNKASPSNVAAHNTFMFMLALHSATVDTRKLIMTNVRGLPRTTREVIRLAF